MNRSELLLGIAGTFAGLAALMVLVATVYRTPVPLVIAAPFGLTAYVMWFQGSGRFKAWVTSREKSRRPRGRRRSAAGPRGAGRSGASSGPQRPGTQSGMSRRAAARVLGVDPDADPSVIRSAYRQRAKSAHPDAETGDRDDFKRLTDAYEVLTE